MHANLQASLNRADELLVELAAEYNRSLQEKTVGVRAVQLTHEVCEKLRSVLDRTARRYWELHISPALSERDRAAASIYFPIAADKQGLDSILGRWRWATVKSEHQTISAYLLSLQPFTNRKNAWLSVLNDLAVKGKHIDLVPQRRLTERRITVSGPSGSLVSWDPESVRFGSGVSIAGVPINPRTQRIGPSSSMTEKVETWVSFVIDEHGVNALGFCQSACVDTRRIVLEMSETFGL